MKRHLKMPPKQVTYSMEKFDFSTTSHKSYIPIHTSLLCSIFKSILNILQKKKEIN